MFTMEHLKVSGAYWCIGALKLMDKLTDDRKDEIANLIKSCQHPCGGIGGNIGHDPHITTTLYGLLILAMYDNISAIDTEKLAEYVKSLQNPDGSFRGDQGGEVDTRFSYCAVSALSLLGKLDTIDRQKARDFVMSCKNIDGAFGGVPGAESHAAYVFTGVGALKILGDVDLIDCDKLGEWLRQRQTPQGGFNGRPDKLADVCYSWWILSSCFMINRQENINMEALRKYILNCQDIDTDGTGGGVADRPGNETDVFHTFFGLAALSLMNKEGLKKINFTYAIPEDTIATNFPHLV